MKKIIVLVAVLVMSVGIYAQAISDPNVQVREAKNFHAISVGSSFKVILTQGNEETVAVSASEEKYLENIKVEVKNGVLEIGWDNKGKWNNGNKKLKAYISFKTIDKLSVSGACDAEITGTLKAEGLEIRLSGASDLKGKLDVAKMLDIDLSGASDGKFSGTAATLKIEASGASSFKGYDFATDVCNAKASGASDIKVTVNKELSVNASGASDVDYKGDAVIKDKKTSGASSVSRQS